MEKNTHSELLAEISKFCELASQNVALLGEISEEKINVEEIDCFSKIIGIERKLRSGESLEADDLAFFYKIEHAMIRFYKMQADLSTIVFNDDEKTAFFDEKIVKIVKLFGFEK